MQDFNVAVVRNVQNNCFYLFSGGNTYTNMNTGKTGEVDEETARKIFRVNLEMTQMISEYPFVKDLITRLKLKYDGTSQT